MEAVQASGRPAQGDAAVKVRYMGADTIMCKWGHAAPGERIEWRPVNDTRYGHQLTALCAVCTKRRRHAGNRAHANGHDGIKHGRHADMGCVQVATGPAKHGILLVPRHGGAGGRA